MPNAAAAALQAVFDQLDQSPNAVEPEAQLTRPIADFLEAFAAESGLGSLFLQREAQLQGVRPDFAALIDGRPCGWVELKAPGHSVDGTTWRGRERSQWSKLAELDSLLVTNGETIRLYSLGTAIGADVELPSSNAAAWDGEALKAMLTLFLSMRPPVIRGVHQLAERLAPMARLLRERLDSGLRPETPNQAVQQAKITWAANVHEGVTDEVFSSDVAQVISYSLAIAALSGVADANGDGLVSLSEARTSLRSSNAVLAAALGPVLEITGLSTYVAPEVGAIERLVSSLDPRAVAASQDPRGEPWLWFYEDFLAAYDPAARERAGVYYTPTSVVQMQVRHVDAILRREFSKPLGFADQNVVTLDPATGSGTYPLAVLDRAAVAAVAQRGEAGPKQVVRHLVSNVLAFELLPGPYAVAHLRIGRRLAELDSSLVPPGNVRVYLTDTLDDPSSVPAQLPLWGDVQVLADERERARTVKLDQPVTVVIGNPPYQRVTGSEGGWVVNPSVGTSLFAELISAAAADGVIFSAQASLYNRYVYFWRWAFWKAFEQDTTRPAIVSFITASSWIDKPVFVGLRDLALRHGDEVWVTDLGGEGRGNNAEDNVFAIQTPVSIVTVFRRGASTSEAAKIYYSRAEGTRAEKLATLDGLDTPTEAPEAWVSHQQTAREGFVPLPARTFWETYPLLTDIFPWQQPGLMINRSWPVSPDPDVLSERWSELLAVTNATERTERFVAGATGRNIHTRVAGLPKLDELPAGSPSRPVVRFSFRSFDREWIINDPRLINLERPALWASLSDQQMFISTMTTHPLGDGPAATLATSPPDKHHFRGSYGGKDVVPLFRDAAAQQANVTAGLLDSLPVVDGEVPTPTDLFAYVYALLAHPGYVLKYRTQLAVAGPRVPMTADPELFRLARDAGRRLLWLHSFGERLNVRFGATIPRVEGIGWVANVDRLPSDGDISFDAATRMLHVAGGQVSGVSPEVWGYSVSGWPVLRRWLESRSLLGRGNARNRPTPLDRIRSLSWLDEWNDELLDLILILTATVEAEEGLGRLLDSIADGPLIDAASLPIPQAWERAEPSSS